MIYTDIFSHKNKLYVREIDSLRKVAFKPSLFIPTRKESEFKNMFGNPLREIPFDSISDMRNYKKQYSEIQDIHGNYSPVVQYLHSTYRDDIHYDLSKIIIYSIDIETTTEKGFPNPELPEEEINVITLSDLVNDKSVCLTTLKADIAKVQTKYPNAKVILLDDEKSLIERFILNFSRRYPHILTSYNGDGFDIPYLTNRALGIVSETYFKRLSPWGLIKVSEVKDSMTGEIKLDYEWKGIQLIDYLPLYKKFSQASPEDYKLDTVAHHELKENKVKNPYDSFKDFYTKDPTLFVEYNIKDALLINRLDRKRRLLAQIIDTAYYAKVCYKDVFSPMRVWDSLIHDYLYQQKVIVHNPSKKKLDKKIIGAAVKEPIPGLYDWTVSFDAKALYPSIARSLNMSPETVVNEESVFEDAEDGIDKLLRGFDNQEFLVENNYSLSANGFFFRRDKMGLFPTMFSRIGKRRDDAKNRMLELEAFIKSYPDKATDEMVNEKETMNSKQGSSKILNNSGYGVMAAVHFRFFDTRISEGITATGQFVIKSAEQILNKGLNSYFKTEGIDYVLYSDTDSLFVKLGGVLSDRVKKEKSMEEITDFIDSFCKKTLAKMLDNGMQEIGGKLNVFENHLYFKREMISMNHLMYKKKKYACAVIDSEGVRYPKPEIKTKGIEIVRRTTPMVVRDYLKTSVNKILLEGYDSFFEYYKSIRDNWDKHESNQLFLGIGNNGMEKYGIEQEVDELDFELDFIEKYSNASGVYKKGTPYHVKAALIHNHYIKEMGLEKKYELIKTKDKVRIAFLKLPNKLGVDTIAFLGDNIPEEFDVGHLVDYQIHFDKTYLSTIKRLTDAIGWKLEDQYSIFD